MTRYLMLLLLCCNCAYGTAQDTQQYGYVKPPPNNSDAGYDPYGSGWVDPITSDCFWETVNDYEGGVAVYYVCDGQSFVVQDLIDPYEKRQ